MHDIYMLNIQRLLIVHEKHSSRRTLEVDNQVEGSQPVINSLRLLVYLLLGTPNSLSDLLSSMQQPDWLRVIEDVQPKKATPRPSNVLVCMKSNGTNKCLLEMPSTH